MSDLTELNGHVIHLPGGDDQEARGAALAGISVEKEEGWPFEVDAGPMADESIREWLFGHDAIDGVLIWMNEDRQSIPKQANRRRKCLMRWNSNMKEGIVCGCG